MLCTTFTPLYLQQSYTVTDRAAAFHFISWQNTALCWTAGANIINSTFLTNTIKLNQVRFIGIRKIALNPQWCCGNDIRQIPADCYIFVWQREKINILFLFSRISFFLCSSLSLAGLAWPVLGVDQATLQSALLRLKLLAAGCWLWWGGGPQLVVAAGTTEQRLGNQLAGFRPLSPAEVRPNNCIIPISPLFDWE